MKRALIKAQIFFILFICLTSISIAQQSSLNYICPVPGSGYINPEQNIILKSSTPFNQDVVENAVVHLNGSKSGPRQIGFILTGDRKILLINPRQKYSLNEKVHVRISGLRTIDGKEVPELEFEFYTKEKELVDVPSFDEWEQGFPDQGDSRSRGKSIDKPNAPDNNLPPDFPGPVTSSSGYASNMYTFTNLSARLLSSSHNNYKVILDNFGTPVYYQRTPNRNHFNFHVMPNGLLTWCKNFKAITPDEKYYIADSSYNIIDSVRTGNGYNLDSHDMLWMENGHYLVMSYDPQPVDMSLIVPGGNPDAIVTGLIIQEVDNNENVFWQWRSWDHFEITDATPDIDLTASKIDYCHGNAFEFDGDGNLLLSSRNMDEITKIDYSNGDIIWRFGKNASNNQFDIINDPVGFSHQHDIRIMPNGHYTLYDNGNLHQSQISKAMEYDIDEVSMQATLVWSFQHEPIIYAPSTGGFRVLENEKRIVGWGASLSGVLMTETNPDNSVSMELFMPDSVTSYRALKYPWKTNKFTTLNDLSFGNYAGHDAPKELFLFINNKSGEVISISSTYNHLSVYNVITQLPINIFPNTSAMITIAFEPEEQGEYFDLLTLNYDNDDNSRRIAQQLTLNGYWEDGHPFVFFNPANGEVNVDPATEVQSSFNEPIRHKGGDEILENDIPEIFIFKENDREGDDVPFTGIISEDKMTITLFPSNVLKEEQQYYVELLADTVEDYDSNVIEYAEGSFFETGMGVGINENNNPFNVSLYPNPCSGTLNVRYRIPDAGQAGMIRLYSVEGRKIWEMGQGEKSPGMHEEMIDMSGFPAGVYYLQVQAGNEAIVMKVVKME